MGDPEEAMEFYSTNLDLSWLKQPYPLSVKRTLLVSADRDLIPAEIAHLKEKFSAIAGDWESGAIAYVASCNQIPCLILRGVTDLVSEQGSVTYNNIKEFEHETNKVMKILLDSLPGWINCCMI
jgi:adenosylhomocysteine nucleosidase